MPTVGTINEEGTNVDLYIPRKCHATNVLIESFDHGAIQLTVGDIDSNGVYTFTGKTLCIAGYLRTEAQSDHAINRLCITHGIIRGRTGKPKKVKPTKKPVAAKGGKPAAAGAKKGGKAAAAAGGAKRPAAGAAAKGAKKPAAKGAAKRPATAPTGEGAKKTAPRPKTAGPKRTA